MLFVVKSFSASIFEQSVSVFRGGGWRAGWGSAADVSLWHGRSLDCWLPMNGFILQPIPQLLWEAGRRPMGEELGGHFDTECASGGSV